VLINVLTSSNSYEVEEGVVIASCICCDEGERMTSFMLREAMASFEGKASTIWINMDII